MNSRITGTSFYAPDKIITNEWIEDKVNVNRLLLPDGILEEKFSVSAGFSQRN
ncbi:MAG: hypothetical protein ABIT96_10760 [Ferruginibacter sp.]